MKKQPQLRVATAYRARSFVITCIQAALMMSCSVATWAHHSFAMYDSQKSVELKGTVKEFSFGNPHTLIMMVIKDEAGEAKDYTIETNGSFNLAKSHGWNRESLKRGDAIVALITPLRDGSPGGDLLKITFNDGHELIARSPPYPPLSDK